MTFIWPYLLVFKELNNYKINKNYIAPNYSRTIQRQKYKYY